MHLRKAVASDCQSLFDWRNHPQARHYSINQTPLDFTSHQAWFSASLSSSNRWLWIGIESDKSVGVCRFDETDSPVVQTVSINLNPDFYGKGYGFLLLAIALSKQAETSNVKEFQAVIKPENAASLRLFEKAGFQKMVRTDLVYMSKFL